MTTRFYNIFLLTLLISASAMSCKSFAQTPLPQDDNKAVILSYQRIDEDTQPDTSLRFAQFAAHIDELTDGPYHIVALSDVIAAYTEKDAPDLPANAVAITFSGGYRSIMADAIPLLLDKNLPFAVFIAPTTADMNQPAYLGWKDIRDLGKNRLITLGLHSASYDRLSGLNAADIRQDLTRAQARLREETGLDARFFAYPFGDFDATYRKIVIENGFDAAFGLQSGVAWEGADLWSLPRFTMTDRYASLDRLRLVATALPLPVQDVYPSTPRHNQTEEAGDITAIGFSVAPALRERLDRLSCFVSGQPAPGINVLGESGRVELRLSEMLEEERTRINCTLPVPARDGGEEKWRWFGMLLTQGDETALRD